MRPIEVKEDLKVELDFIFTEIPRKQRNLFRLSSNFTKGKYKRMQEVSKLSFFKFIEIVNYGYVLIESKEDKLLRIYKIAKELAEAGKSIEDFYYVSGLKTAIDILGLDVK